MSNTNNVSANTIVAREKLVASVLKSNTGKLEVQAQTSFNNDITCLGNLVLKGNFVNNSESSVESSNEIKVTFPGDSTPMTPDYIICGAGMAGCALARKLSDQNKRVLVLELGKDQTGNPVIEYPFSTALYRGQGPEQGNFFNASYDPEYNSFLCNPEVPGNQSRLVPIWGAHMIGGGGGHWFTIYYRPSKTILDGPLPSAMVPPGNVNTASFADAGGAAWDATVMDPIMTGIENFRLQNYIPGGGGPGYTENPGYRGYGGPESVIQLSPWSGGLPVAANELAYMQAMSTAAPLVQGGAAAPILQDYNNVGAGAINSVSQFQYALNGATFERQNTKVMFLNGVVGPDGKGNLVGLGGRKLVILAQRNVCRVIPDLELSQTSFVAKGVEFLWTPLNGVEGKYFVCGKNVVNCMGAGYGPLMWQRSGIGPAAVLSRAKIPLQIDSPFIGQNLTNQFGPSFNMTCDDPNFLSNFPAVGSIQYNGVASRWTPFLASYGVQTSGFVDGASASRDTSICEFHISNTMTQPRSRGYINQIKPGMGPNTTDLQWGFYSDGPDAFDAMSGLYSAKVSFTGSITGSTLTVATGSVSIGQTVFGPGIPRTTSIVSGTGPYTLSLSVPAPVATTTLYVATFNVVGNDSDIATACACVDFSYQWFLNIQAAYPMKTFANVNFPPACFVGYPAAKSTRYPLMVQYITGYNFAQSHDSGTVVMGSSAATGAVDGNLKLYGTSNCFHCDKAIFPIASTGNPGGLIQACGINGANVIPLVAIP